MKRGSIGEVTEPGWGNFTAFDNAPGEQPKAYDPPPEPAKPQGRVQFKVGDKVKPFWSESTGIVVSVDPNANHGTGRLVIRMESGSEHVHLFFGHGFEKVE